MSGIRTRLIRSVSIDDDTDCWNWTRIKNKCGYGRLFMGSKSDNTRRNLQAHRVSFETFVGEIPEGLLVLHICDNRACINPDHLYLGTHKDNTTDMDKRGRRGKRMRGCAIDIHMARLIKKDLLIMNQKTKIARKHNVPYHVVKDIAYGKSWRLA